MNQIAKIDRGADPVLPAVSPDLQRAIGVAEYDHEGLMRYGVKAAVAAEAKAVLAQIDAAPASPGEIAEWLRPIAGSVSNPPSGRAELGVRAATIAVGCGDLPAALFSKQAQMLGIQRWKFWPSASEVRETVLDANTPFVDRRKALRAIAFAPVSDSGARPEGRSAPSQDEKKAVSEMVARLREEVAARQAEKVRATGGRPIVLSPEQLVAAYRRARDEASDPMLRAAAAARLKTLGVDDE